MTRPSPESGISILELLVGLAILAGLLVVVVAATVRPATPTGLSDPQRLIEFIAEARITAILTGQARLLRLAPSEARVGTSKISWIGTMPGLGTDAGGRSIVLYPDGTTSSPIPSPLLAADGPSRTNTSSAPK